MPKGDKRMKLKKRKIQNTPGNQSNKELILKAEMEEYGFVTKLCGDCKVMVQLPDTSTIMCRIPGKMRKKAIVKLGNIVLISKREYQATMADIIVLYTPIQVRELLKMGEIPNSFMGDAENDIENGIVMLEEIKDEKGKDDDSASLSDL